MFNKKGLTAYLAVNPFFTYFVSSYYLTNGSAKRLSVK